MYLSRLGHGRPVRSGPSCALRGPYPTLPSRGLTLASNNATMIKKKIKKKDNGAGDEMETGRAGRPEARSDLFGLGLVGVPVEPSAVPLVIIGTGDLGKPAFTIPTVCQCQCHNRIGWFHA
jgi:hypothetical protein